MSLTLAAASHLDHNLTPEHVAWLLAQFADKDAFFIATVELPENLAPLECGLYGPTVGDEPVAEADVTYAIRGARKCASRMTARPVRPTRLVTVIAGPHEDKPCVLYTAYGGPAAPREPGDLTIPSWEEIQKARAFWAEHALSTSA